MASISRFTIFASGLVVAVLAIESGAAQRELRASPPSAPGRARVSSRSAVAPAGGTPSTRSSAGAGRIVPAQHESADSPRDKPNHAAEGPAALPADDEHVDPLDDLLEQNVTPIDLPRALQLAGEQNPQILLGQQRVVEAVALRQLAAAQFLPTLNLGVSSDNHWGVLQQSNGNILSLRREVVFIGAGAHAVAAGTVNIPGVLWNLNLSDAVFNFLTSRQEVDRNAFESQAVRQDVLLDVALAYSDLVRAEGERSIALVTRDNAREVARITAAYLETGQGRKADADRAATELARRDARLYEAEGNVVRASAGLCRLLHLDPSLRLHAADNQVLPRSLVPDPIPLPELLAVALLSRPELNERRTAAAQALLRWRAAKLLPFSPTLFVGFSAGGFGGGSDVAAQPVTSLPFGRGQARFTTLDDREDFDVMAFWTLQNLGVGNKALIDAARSRLSSADLETLVTLDRVRAEVAGAYARTHARFAQIRTCELAIQSGTQAFTEDLERSKGGEGLPLEVLDSLRLLARAREQYLKSILDYNKAQFELYVALGKPPGKVLMRPEAPARPVSPENDGSDRPSRENPQENSIQVPPLDPLAGAAALEGLSQDEVVPPAGEVRLIDLPTALQLAEAENPTIALGRQAIVEALALQTAARGMLLPTLAAGSNYHLHQGVLQTSFGQIRNLNEQSLYVGGGARTLAAETLAIPAVRIFSHLGDALFAPLAARQVVCSRSADSVAIQNAMLLTVVRHYLELAMAEASLDAIHRGEESMRVIVQATAAFASTGQGREGDFNRARTDALLLHAEEQRLQEEVAVASAELSRVLHLDPSICLRTHPGALEMVQLVDPDNKVESLVQLAQSARPELAARSADIAAAEYRVRQETTRPLFPLLAVGFSGGAFGGGSNRQDLGVPAFFQTFGGRTDFDVWAIWSLQNMGFGNRALQKQSRAERDQAIAARGLAANRIAREVGDAYSRVEAARRQVQFAQSRLQSAVAGAREEVERTRGGEGLPIEAINSVNLLGQAGLALVEAISSFDLAQFGLFVAVGQTPHAALPDPARGAPQ
jgi:outer membrane protein TolC